MPSPICYFGPRVCSSRVSAQTKVTGLLAAAISPLTPRAGHLFLALSLLVPGAGIPLSRSLLARRPPLPLPPPPPGTASHSLTSEGVDAGRPVGDRLTAEQKIPEAGPPRVLWQIGAWEPVPRPR